jgi:hypothetical protein
MFATCRAQDFVLELEVRRIACRRCGAVKRERLDVLADNPTSRGENAIGEKLEKG